MLLVFLAAAKGKNQIEFELNFFRKIEFEFNFFRKNSIDFLHFGQKWPKMANNSIKFVQKTSCTNGQGNPSTQIIKFEFNYYGIEFELN